MMNAQTIRPKLLSEADTARYIGMSRAFLRKSRLDGTRRNHTPGPPYIRIGRAIRYDLDDLNQWIAAHRKEIR